MKWPWLFAALLTGFVLPAGAEEKVQTDLYTVVDGYMVDPNTLQGFRTWRAAACDRCHGANQEGLVGPALVESLKVLTREEFKKTVTDGRLEKGKLVLMTGMGAGLTWGSGLIEWTNGGMG